MSDMISVCSHCLRPCADGGKLYLCIECGVLLHHDCAGMWGISDGHVCFECRESVKAKMRIESTLEDVATRLHDAIEDLTTLDMDDPPKNVCIATALSYARSALTATQALSAMKAKRYAVVLVTNRTRSRVMVQRKDDTYAMPRSLCLFGGSIEHNESPMTAIIRELREELGEQSAEDIVPRLQAVGKFGPFMLFESVLDDSMIEAIAERPVYEGERAEIIERGDLKSLDWLGGHLDMIEASLARHSVFPGTHDGFETEKST